MSKLSRAQKRAPVVMAGVLSLGLGGVGVVSAAESEPQWNFGTCGKMHMIAVNSASDSVFDRNSDEDAGFFADNITLPALERVGQSVDNSSGGITDSRDTDWGVGDGKSAGGNGNWWSTPATTVSKSSDTAQVEDSFVEEKSHDAVDAGTEGSRESGEQQWLTRTYINVDVLGSDVDTGGAVTAVNETLGKVERQCPDTRVILTGFAEGARVASLVARQIGSGDGVVAPSKIAGVALFSDPLRDQDQPVVASGADVPEGLPVGYGVDSQSWDSADIAAQMSALVTSSHEPGVDSDQQTSVKSKDLAEEGEGATESFASQEPEALKESSSQESSVDATPSMAGPTELMMESGSEMVQGSSSSVALPAGISSLPRVAPEGYQRFGQGGVPGVPGSFARAQGPVTGGGISALTAGVGDFGALAAKTVSWCIDGDLVCGMPEGSATRSIVDAIAPDVRSDNPVAALTAVADTLGPAVVLGGLESVAEDVSFGPGGFQVARASNPDETLIGRIATEAQRADSRSLGDMGARVLAASSKIAGMGLAAGITVARKTLTPSNLAAISAAGATDPLLGIGVATAKFAEAALETVSIETATGLAGRVFDEVQAAGLDEKAVASVATDVATWSQLASNDSYAQVPVTADGRSATDATVDWISSLSGADVGAPSGVQAAGFDSAAAQSFLTDFV